MTAAKGAAHAGERCAWAGNDALYIAYHDEEWGVPKTEDQEFFEKLILEGFQAGLSWITILRKREAFREAFARFDAEKIARFSESDVARLVLNEGIIRHRGKIEAAIANAKAYLEFRNQRGFAEFFWSFVDGKPKQNRFKSFAEVPAQTAESQAIAKALKAHGFRFCGPTTVYALMQSLGLVNDHLVYCPRHEACASLGKTFAIA